MKPLLEVRNLSKTFSSKARVVQAVQSVSFEIFSGEIFGLVGESGSGKSTLGRMLLQLERPSSGEVVFDNIPLEEKRRMSCQAQMIFQDPYAALNPRMTVREIVAEPLRIHKMYAPHKVEDLFSLVGLGGSFAGRFPHELSGGQRQRVGIARALAVNPKFIVCDEPLSALDVSVQAQIVCLLKELQSLKGLTYLFIAHDLAMVKYISTRAAVMYRGHFVELAPTDELFSSPLHPYTQLLLSAIPIPDPRVKRKQIRIPEISEQILSSKGCVFQARCPHATALCREEAPAWQEISPGHFASCHYAKSMR